MSISTSPSRNRRTSTRRKQKTFKSIHEQQFENPFRIQKSNILPDHLYRQIRKLDYFSRHSLKTIQLNQPALSPDDSLQRMRMAVEDQRNKYKNYFSEEIQQIPCGEGPEGVHPDSQEEGVIMGAQCQQSNFFDDDYEHKEKFSQLDFHLHDLNGLAQLDNPEQESEPESVEGQPHKNTHFNQDSYFGHE